jgi:hypothetical protein
VEYFLFASLLGFVWKLMVIVLTADPGLLTPLAQTSVELETAVAA